MFVVCCCWSLFVDCRSLLLSLVYCSLFVARRCCSLLVCCCLFVVCCLFLCWFLCVVDCLLVFVCFIVRCCFVCYLLLDVMCCCSLLRVVVC